jgi:LmbE family N-acetylglucosaminyl deacetylase
VLKKTLFLSFALLACAAAPGRTEEALSFTSTDRVLVIAPHPDDETLGLGGLLQRAKSAGAATNVLYLTNGESNEVASLFYQKRPLLWRSDFVKSGVTRKKEAMEAMKLLGFDAGELVFFGYPDGGMMNLWTKHWGAASRPFRSLFTRLSRVPYKDNFSYGRAFKGEEVLSDLKRVMASFRPTAVFVTAPFDLNPDHQAAYLFTDSALRDLQDSGPSPALYVYLVHAHRWPEPKKHMPDRALEVPDHIDWGVRVDWEKFPLSAQEVKKKGEAILLYKSQLAYKKHFLLAFARKNEIFAKYPAQKMARSTEPVESKVSFDEQAVPGEVRCGIFGDELWLAVPFTSALDEMGVLSSYVFGYKDGTPFSEMPKLTLRLFGNKLFAYDGARPFHDNKLVYRIENEQLFVRLPLGLLKDPQVLFVSTRNAKEELSLDFGAWKAYELA